MPLDALPYSELMEKHGFIPANHAAPKFFPVEARKVYDENGHELDGWQRIVRSDDGTLLHVATAGYRLITNEEAFGGFEEALSRSSLDLTDMRIGTDYAANGARCFRQYLLPAHRVEVKAGVEVALRLLMMNSYDGSLNFRGQCGAYDFVCANTSIHGEDYAQFSMRHSKFADVPRAIEGLTKAAEDHLVAVNRWKAWPQIRVNDQTAIELCGKMPSATQALVDSLIHGWLRERDGSGPQSGPNLWTLFNVLTAWATHHPDKVKGGRGQAVFDRQKRVQRLVQSDAWKKVAEAA